MSYRKGDRVTATTDLGGVIRESVPAGSTGTVTETTPTGEPTEVAFPIDGTTRVLRVDPGEVR
ncbi:MAG: hypothetical protein JWN03_6135 [Nocardia sp.]|uniref:hypothetical protein n=1 Tax=Nocardia sp. TaxID=1821 RepID=UPI002636BCA6|nr:hypothetical protein [Nocardia sp.]MCU1645860.1 hypothetical protein [Nocardia sp.]